MSKPQAYEWVFSERRDCVPWGVLRGKISLAVAFFRKI